MNCITSLVFALSLAAVSAVQAAAFEIPNTAAREVRAVSDSPADYPNLIHQAEAKFAAKEYGAAGDLWDRALALNPTTGAWAELGQARYEAKEYQKAIAAYEKALALGVGYRWSSAYDIACCWALLGDKQQALTWLEKAMNAGFRDLGQVQKDPDLSLLHTEARFKELALVADVASMSRDEGWRHDLRVLAHELLRLHYTHGAAVAAPFANAVHDLNETIPTLNDDEIGVGFMRLARMMGDAHTRIGPVALREGAHRLPVQFYLFEEGLFIIAATPAHANLLGAQVVRIGDSPIADVLATLDRVISQDNSMWPKMAAPNLLRSPNVLHGLKLLPGADKMAMTLRLASGREETVSLTPDAGDVKPDWPTANRDGATPPPLTLKNRQAAYWYEYLPESKTVFCQYNAVRNDPGEPLDKFCARMFKFIDDNAVDRLVLDMRWNGGGNNFLNKPLVEGLMRCDKVNQRGKLFVIVGRNTFSAAQCGATQIERYTHAIFVGEPTGSRPNFVGESIPINLPYSKMQGTVSDLYWQNSVAMDYRVWLAPEIYAPPTFEAYRANRDVAMEAIAKFTYTP